MGVELSETSASASSTWWPCSGGVRSAGSHPVSACFLNSQLCASHWAWGTAGGFCPHVAPRPIGETGMGLTRSGSMKKGQGISAKRIAYVVGLPREAWRSSLGRVRVTVTLG